MRYIIAVDVNEDEININISKKGRFFDEASFHPSDKLEMWKFFSKLPFRLIEDAQESE